MPFEIPDNWEWKSWGEVSYKIQYGYNAPAKDTGVIKMVRITDIQDNQVLWDSVPFCNIKENEIPDYLLHNFDILFARTGGTVGKSFLVENINEDSVFAGYLIRTVYNYNEINPKYLKYFMETSLYWSQLKKGTIATAQPNCNGQTLSKMILPIPPLQEQHRIVAKLQELEPLIEKYRIAEEQLHELNSNIKDQLKKSILQYAIEGKLVPQDPNDEPASVLLERIREEKQQLIKEGKIKKDKNESIIFRRDNSYYEKFGNTEFCIDDEIKCSVPINWILTRQKNLCWLNNGNLSKGEILPYLEVKVLRGNKEAETKDSGVIVTRGTNVILVDGENSGEVMKIKYRGYMGSTFKILQTSNFVNEKYVDIIFQCNRIKYKHNKKGAAIPHLDKELFNNTLIFLPPITEQQRILEKINLITHLL
ncbi:restriction endonuclease subunit S [Amedibacillus dolichus]|uniref:Type I restriction modification DNA specificity domain protein n=1 Tax=Amedibacillus dolichus DSM 3991 TaxID=428127 RepID=A8RCC1_9FIRM|nr:restriction endonuclease subunit S [Amedibacillus dolichus]EDP11014.1 type I restriction modification DNA specificity domain protein [Amedibacillus dolichus DSM 3991]